MSSNSTGYVFRSEWMQRVRVDGQWQEEPRYFIDWESAAETVEEVVTYARQWKDGYEGSVVRFTAEVEPVASIVGELEKSPPPAPGQRELFA